MSKIDPGKQIGPIKDYDDDYLSSLSFGQNLEDLPANLEDNLKAIITQIRRIIGKSNWYDDPDSSLSLGVSLDQAYDFGGSGAGRTITVDSGAVQMDAGTGFNALEISGIISSIGTNEDITIAPEPTGTGEINLGITITTPVTTVVHGQIQILGGSPASGKILTSDGTGLASWTNPAGITLPWTTAGDFLYRNSSNVDDRLPVGTNEQIITSDGTVPFWSSTLTIQTLRVKDDFLTLNFDATSTGADFQYRLRRPTTGMAANIDLIFPDSTGISGQFLYTTGSGVLDWITISGGGFPSFADISDNSPDNPNQTFTIKNSTRVLFEDSTSSSTLFRIDEATGTIGVGTDTTTDFLLRVDGHVGPNSDSTYTLGSSSLRWLNTFSDTFTGDILNVGTINLTGFTQGSVVFVGSGGSLDQDNANLFWDDSNNRLGIGTDSPSEDLSIDGNIGLDGELRREDAAADAPLIAVPKGTGAFQLSSSGDARGSYAIDLQIIRSSSTEVASGDYSFIAGGKENTTSGSGSHAEGYSTTATALASHVEGIGTSTGSTFATGSHAEGFYSTTYGAASHAEGYMTTAGDSPADIGAHSEGRGTSATNNAGHAEGYNTTSDGVAAHSEGRNTTSTGNYSHAEGYSTVAGDAAGDYGAHAEGAYTYAYGYSSHAEGKNTTASGTQAHAEGLGTLSSGIASHAEGYMTQATNTTSHSEGNYTYATGINSHSEGLQTTASGGNSHAQGFSTLAQGAGSHVEGSGTRTATTAAYSHAEGRGGYARLQTQHAHGNTTGSGERQYTRTVMRRTTSDATTSELTLNGTAPITTTNRFIVPSDTAIAFTIDISGRQASGTNHGFFTRRGMIENTGGTTAMVGTVHTATDGTTDINTAGTWTVAIAADNTNDALTVSVTGVAATDIEWMCVIHATELNHI